MTAFFKFGYLLNWKAITSVFLICLTLHVYSQVPPPPPCLANGNNGFGGAVGEGVFPAILTSTNPITFGMMIFPGSGNIDDILVLYIHTGASGRTEIDNTVEDNGDVYRIAITNSNLFDYGSHITFPPGFEATHAIAVDINFGALYEIPSSGTVGTNDLNMVTTVNSTLTSPTQSNYQFSFNWEDIGLNEGDEFRFVALYVRDDAYSSDEGYGSGITAGTSGSDPITFTGSIIIPGCVRTLSTDTTHASDSIQGYYINNQLIVKGLNESAIIRVFDIYGRKIYQKQHEVNDATPINLELNKNQLHFIVVESLNAKKVLKVIPN